ncbi:lysostaphin resistance A-like protein [Microbulbifer sp.]|uniref:CPBP family intramembrane glutamic endopeptidase n=1 Tax=Microbulbifer sp. TaxID=1908541 RepID=UPI003F67A18B
MMNTSVVAPHPRPFFEVTGLHFRLWPILFAGLLMQGILWPARQVVRWLYHSHPDLLFGQTWAFVGIAMLLQALGGLIGILAMRRLLPTADGHLRWPPGRSYAGLAAAMGVAMGLVMLVADYWPQLLTQTAPDAGYDLTPVGASGWLAMMAATGLAEETVFRGLLVGMLVVLVPGRVRLGSFEVPFAAVAVGLLFSVAHYETFLVDPLHLAIAQQLYAFVWALVYVWLMEKSRSLLAPIIAHGLGNFTEVALVMLMMSAWN